jgi:hypothetical protein
MVTISIPGPLADFLQESDLEDADLQAYEAGRVVRRGAGYSLEVTATLDTHQYFLEKCWTLEGGKGMEASAAERRGYRAYADRIEQAKKAEG